MIEKEIKYIKICGTVKYELPLDENVRLPPTDSAFSCLIPALGAWFQGYVIQDENKKTETEETDSAHTGKSLEESVKSLEKESRGYTRDINILYERLETHTCDSTSKIDELYEKHDELQKAFEAECDHYDGTIKSIKQDISDLQQAFVKYAICKDTESPEGGKTIITTQQVEPDFVYNKNGEVIGYTVSTIPPSGSSVQADDSKIMTIEEAEKQIRALDKHTDTLLSKQFWDIITYNTIAANTRRVCDLKEWIENQKNIKPPEEPDIVEQIKTGEKRLHVLKWYTNPINQEDIKRKNEEFKTLRDHIEKLVELHTGIKIHGIEFYNPSRILYYNNQKGIRIEFT